MAVSPTQMAKNIKELGWDKINLTTKSFNGAIHNFKTADGKKVALAFNMHDAFIVEDEQGLFAQADLDAGILKPKHINIEDTGYIDGATTVAWEQDGEFFFNEDKLTELGLNDFEIKESLKKRLFNLAQLDVLEDMPL